MIHMKGQAFSQLFFFFFFFFVFVFLLLFFLNLNIVCYNFEYNSDSNSQLAIFNPKHTEIIFLRKKVFVFLHLYETPSPLIK